MTKTPKSTRRPWRFLLLLISFPIAGLIVSLVLGRSLDPLQALAGGAIVGVFTGIAGAWALSLRWRWVLGTTVGLAVGTSAAVFLSDQPLLAALIQGAVLAIAQSVVRPPIAPVAWAALTVFMWFIAWAVSLQVAIGDEPGFAIFGASGALCYVVITWLAATRGSREVVAA